MAIVGSMLSCNETKEPQNKIKQEKDEIIGKADPSIANGRLTPEVLYSLARVGSFSISPDGKRILYGVTYPNITQNRMNTELVLMDIDGANKSNSHSPTDKKQTVSGLTKGAKLLFSVTRPVPHRYGPSIPTVEV